MQSPTKAEMEGFHFFCKYFDESVSTDIGIKSIIGNPSFFYFYLFIVQNQVIWSIIEIMDSVFIVIWLDTLFAGGGR